jgi:large subunit ribosomal protein L5
MAQKDTKQKQKSAQAQSARGGKQGGKKGAAAPDEAPTPKAPKITPRFRTMYAETIRSKLQKELELDNIMRVPRVVSIIVSMGVGEAVRDEALAQDAANDLAIITGQRPVLIKARRSVSNFKLREGMTVGCKVTLRGDRMYEFMERLLCVALPRVRDFRGVSPNAFDGRGNYSLGLADQLVFPEINPDQVKRQQGMNIAIVTTAHTDAEGRALLREFGMPFARTS